MSNLKFHGNSDDTFGEYGRTNTDHDNCASGKPIYFRVSHGDDSLVVFGQYGLRKSGVWAVGIMNDKDIFGEEKPIPKWPIQLRASNRMECGYSPTLEIDAPSGVKIELADS